MPTYTPIQLLKAMQHRVRPDSFIRSRWAKGTPIVTDKTVIEIDKYTKNQGIAVYNSRTGAPSGVKKQNFSTDTHVAPYVFEEISMTPEDVNERTVGQTVYGVGAANTKQSLELDNLETLSYRFDRLEEKQYVEAITSGTVTVENEDAGVSYTVDYGMSDDNKITLTGDDVWGGVDSDIEGNLETWGQLLMKKGRVATDVILDVNAAAKYRADTSIKATLDNRGIESGRINPRLLADQRVSYVGTYNGVGVNVDVWCYLGGYETEEDTFSYYLDTNRAIMLAAGIEIQQVYGKLENFKTNFKAARFTQMVEDKYGKIRELTMESSPLAILRNPNAIVSAKVGA